MIENKKILILSVSAWNSKVGADTWPTLVSGLDPEKIASISLREEIPDSPNCNNYFVLSESKVLRSIFKRGVCTGRRVSRAVDDGRSNLAEHNLRYEKMGKKRSFWGLLAREAVWLLGKWKTQALDDFLDAFQPNVIMYSMDGYVHFNRICRYAKKRTGAKSIGFFVDDNFTYKQSSRLGMLAFRVLQRRSLKKLAKQTDGFWAITDMTKKEADETFRINCTVVTKPLNKEPVFAPWQVNTPIRVLYTGNLQIGRDRSLVKVVNALKEINRDKIHFQVDVYTKTHLSQDIIQQLHCDFCTVHPPVSQSQVLGLQQQADILLFLEDVDGPDARTARLSFSTKITDYLSSGKSIFAVGCMDTAPMQYLADNDAGIVAVTQQEMLDKFKRILLEPSLLHGYAQRACALGLGNHRKEQILKTVQRTIEQL